MKLFSLFDKYPLITWGSAGGGANTAGGGGGGGGAGGAGGGQEQVEVLEVEEKEEEGTLGREEDPMKNYGDLKYLFHFLMFNYCLWPGRDCLRSSSYLILLWDSINE